MSGTSPWAPFTTMRRGIIRYRESFQRDTADRVVETAFTTGDGKRLGRRVFLFQGNKAIGWDDYDASDNRIAAGAARPRARAAR